ncbi:ABC transporter permease [Nocardioides sp. LHD-245]|uniref:ABC transporter permease n=1 Tax=Nocardioides sp. LHD-245 TaxID=3051387 RepID=UPI0027E123FB|nr:ABC transporter permease [Nocardioides sp. LHD-245]
MQKSEVPITTGVVPGASIAAEVTPSPVGTTTPAHKDTRADTVADAVDRRADRRERLVIVAGQVGIGVGFLAVWQLVSGLWIDRFFISEPSLIAERIVDLAASGELWMHLRVTVIETGIGLAIGLPAGVILGIAVATSRIAGRWVYPYIIALYSLPRVALAPLFIVWFGIGLFSKVMMVVTMVLFVAFYNVYQGVKSIDRDLLDMTKSYRASRWITLRWVMLPAIGAWMLTALRLAIGLGLIGAIIAELIGSSVGIGYYIKLSSNLFDTTGVMTGLLVITVLAMLLEQVVAFIEKRVLRYR